MAGGSGGTGGGSLFGPDYSSPPSDVAPGGGTYPYISPTQQFFEGAGLSSLGRAVGSGQSPIPSMPSSSPIAGQSGGMFSPIPEDQTYMQLILQSLQSLQGLGEYG